MYEVCGTICAIDIFCLSETHMQDEPEELYSIDGYSFISKPRCNGLGGGVAIYISERINWTRRYDLESELECVWIEVFPIKSKSFLICAIYRPPDSSSYTHANFENLFANMLNSATADSKEAIIMGDLNVNYRKKDDHPKIKAIISVNGFKQIVKKATRTTLKRQCQPQCICLHFTLKVMECQQITIINISLVLCRYNSVKMSKYNHRMVEIYDGLKTKT
jgi:exonuclease III